MEHQQGDHESICILNQTNRKKWMHKDEVEQTRTLNTEQSKHKHTHESALAIQNKFYMAENAARRDPCQTNVLPLWCWNETKRDSGWVSRNSERQSFSCFVSIAFFIYDSLLLARDSWTGATVILSDKKLCGFYLSSSLVVWILWIWAPLFQLTTNELNGENK